jgi:hypothetical protein
MYPWYDVIECETNLEQGDFISACPIIVPPNSNLTVSGEVDIQVNEYDVVVMSQSCDLIERKIKLVIVCPMWSLSAFEEENLDFKSKGAKENLRQGKYIGLHLLNKCEIPQHGRDYLIVDFRSIYSVDLEFIEFLAKQRGKRLRLLPPYREHLSQAFSRFFMRVGLPMDIPPFK